VLRRRFSLLHRVFVHGDVVEGVRERLVTRGVQKPGRRLRRSVKSRVGSRESAGVGA